MVSTEIISWIHWVVSSGFRGVSQRRFEVISDRQTHWHIKKIMARCTTRGLREHSLRINSGLGGDMLTRLDKKKDDRRTNGQIAKN